MESSIFIRVAYFYHLMVDFCVSALIFTITEKFLFLNSKEFYFADCAEFFLLSVLQNCVNFKQFEKLKRNHK